MNTWRLAAVYKLLYGPAQRVKNLECHECLLIEFIRNGSGDRKRIRIIPQIAHNGREDLRLNVRRR
jgi:hypothetical protein